jgi:hypothetical protein
MGVVCQRNRMAYRLFFAKSVAARICLSNEPHACILYRSNGPVPRDRSFHDHLSSYQNSDRKSCRLLAIRITPFNPLALTFWILLW